MEGNNHYITTDTANRILSGWSDGPCPEQDTTSAILLREDGGYQFRLFEGGEENPCLTDEIGAHLYRYENGQIRLSTADEIEAERQEIIANTPPPVPTIADRMEAVETGKADKQEVQAVWEQMAVAYAEGVMGA